MRASVIVAVVVRGAAIVAPSLVDEQQGPATSGRDERLNPSVLRERGFSPTRIIVGLDTGRPARRSGRGARVA